MSPRTYHHGDLRRALIEAALELVDDHGVHGFSLREAAKKAGVAASAPYRHFKDRKALMTAVAETSLKAIQVAMDEAGARANSPLDKFRSEGIAYVLFAAQHPAQFRVLHDAECVNASDSELLTGYLSGHNQLAQRTLAALSSPQEARDDIMAWTASTLMYGLARQIVDGLISPMPDLAQVEALALAMTQAFGEGIQAAYEHKT